MSKKGNKSVVVAELINGIDELEEFYTLIQPELFREKLKEQPDLIQSLIETYRQIQNYFGENFKEVELKYEEDPESVDEGFFFLVVRTKLPLSEARVILNKFNDEWFLNEDMRLLNSIFTVVVRPHDF